MRVPNFNINTRVVFRDGPGRFQAGIITHCSVQITVHEQRVSYIVTLPGGGNRVKAEEDLKHCNNTWAVETLIKSVQDDLDRLRDDIKDRTAKELAKPG